MRVNIAFLRLLTLIYSSISLFPFFIGWMKWYLGFPLAALLLISYIVYARNLDFKLVEYYPKWSFLIFTIFIIAWVSFSGAGGMGFQVTDLYKSNTLVSDLIKFSWPLEYNSEGETYYLSHYLAYYLPAPTFFGSFGYKFTQLALFGYTTVGVFLGFFWLHRFSGGNMIFLVIFLVLFGGVTVFSFMGTYGSEAMGEFMNKIRGNGYVFWLNSRNILPINYMSVTDMLYWTPQHMIPAFLGSAIILNDMFVDKDIKYTPYFLSLLAMWSPLVLVGFFPILVYIIFTNGIKSIFNIQNLLIAPLIFLFLATFLLAIDAEELVKHFIFQYQSTPETSLTKKMGVYIYFLFCEVLIWAIPTLLISKGVLSQREKHFLIFTSVLLLLIPLYRFGLWNDWCTRVSMPSLIILSVYAYKVFSHSQKTLKAAILMILLMGSPSAVIALGGSFLSSGKKVSFNPQAESEVKTLAELCETYGYPLDQFVAKQDSFFFKYFAK